MTTYTVTDTGNTTNNGTAFVSVLSSCTFGDTIVLMAGVSYAGNFNLPYKGAGTGTDADIITIKSSALASIPDVRLNPVTQVGNLAKLISPSSNATLTSSVLAHHYKLQGLEITSDGSTFAPDLVDIGQFATRLQMPLQKGFTFDRCFVHTFEISAPSNMFPSTLNRSSGRGIYLQTADTYIDKCYIAGFAGKYLDDSAMIDSYGVYSVVGPGPYWITDNYIEAQFNNIFLGGGDNDSANTATVSAPTISSCTLTNVSNLAVNDYITMKYGSDWQVGKVNSISGFNITFTIEAGLYSPTPAAPDNGGIARWNGDHIHDVTIQGNSLWKPDAWNAFSAPKSYIEVKDGHDILIEGNSLYSGVGTAMAFTVRNQGGGMPWAGISNLIFRYNRINGYQNTAFGIQLKDNERTSVGSGPVYIHDNLIIGERPYGTFPAKLFTATGGDGYYITHNTIQQLAAIWNGIGFVSTNVVVKDNICCSGFYGPQCYIDPGNLTDCFPSYIAEHNVIVDTRVDPTPPLSTIISGTNYYPVNQAAVGFVDAATENFRLAPSSPYKNLASDGTDPGVDWTALLDALGEAGTPSMRIIFGPRS